MFAKSGDDLDSERNGGLVIKQEREALAVLDDEVGVELARKIDFDEADVGAGEPAGWCGGVVWTSGRGCSVNGGLVGGEFWDIYRSSTPCAVMRYSPLPMSQFGPELEVTTAGLPVRHVPGIHTPRLPGECKGRHR
jgi:hypothetical protein